MSKHLQLGGLKLKNPSKGGFKAVYDMMNSSSGKLKLLTYNSLKGFMFILDVSDDHSEYFTLNESLSKFDKPVTSFILKFAVITPKNDESLDIYRHIKKSSESIESYFDEAKLQQQIWKNSIMGKRPEICPPVANFCVFDNINSKELMIFLQSKTTDTTTQDVFNYLFNCVNKSPTNEIGVIVMPRVENSTTLGDFIDTSKPEDTEMAYAYVTAQIARLFINIGVIHFDLHPGNALIYVTGDNNDIKSIIIDFGRASNIMTDNDDDYLKISEKKTIIQKKEDFFNRLFSLNTDAPNKEKKKLILDILNYIASIDLKKNQELYPYSNPASYQMDWYINYPKDNLVPVTTFNILKQITTTEGSGMLPATIRQYERQGFLIDFSKDVSNFIVPFPGTEPTLLNSSQNCDNVDESTGMCVIMGGRKSKKYRKSKRSIQK